MGRINQQDMNEYISLQSINPSINRYRGYMISLFTLKTNVTHYVVMTRWGRRNKLSSSLTKIFTSESDATKYVNAILSKRKRNGYSLVSQSKSFPIENRIPFVPTPQNHLHQLSIF